MFNETFYIPPQHSELNSRDATDKVNLMKQLQSFSSIPTVKEMFHNQICFRTLINQNFRVGAS